MTNCTLAALLLHASILLFTAIDWRGQNLQRAAVIVIELVDHAPRTKGMDANASSRERSDAGAEQVAPPVRTELSGRAKASGAAKFVSNGNQVGLKVTGDNTVPPRPDARFHNAAPGYPLTALRERAEGDVLLVIHVTAAGLPEFVAVQASSGHPDLDQAARDAVARWRFVPARNAEGATSFEFKQVIRFRLGETR